MEIQALQSEAEDFLWSLLNHPEGHEGEPCAHGFWAFEESKAKKTGNSTMKAGKEDEDEVSPRAISKCLCLPESYTLSVSNSTGEVLTL